MASTKAAADTAAEKKAVDPWKDMVTVKLPKGGRHEENFIIVGVNGHKYKLMKGVSVEVPACIAEVLHNNQVMFEQAEDYASNQVND